MKFLAQGHVAHRPLQAADRVLDTLVHGPPVTQHQGNLRRRLIDRRVGASVYAVANLTRGISHARIGELRLARHAEQQRGGARVIDAELAFQSGLRRLLP